MKPTSPSASAAKIQTTTPPTVATTTPTTILTATMAIAIATTATTSTTTTVQAKTSAVEFPFGLGLIHEDLDVDPNSATLLKPREHYTAEMRLPRQARKGSPVAKFMR